MLGCTGKYHVNPSLLFHFGKQAAEDSLENAAVAVVVDLDRGIEPGYHLEAVLLSVSTDNSHSDFLPGLNVVAQAGHIENFLPGQAE